MGLANDRQSASSVVWPRGMAGSDRKPLISTAVSLSSEGPTSFPLQGAQWNCATWAFARRTPFHLSLARVLLSMRLGNRGNTNPLCTCRLAVALGIDGQKRMGGGGCLGWRWVAGGPTIIWDGALSRKCPCSPQLASDTATSQWGDSQEWEFP